MGYSSMVYRKNTKKPLCWFNLPKHHKKVPRKKIIEEVSFQHTTTSISRKERENKIYLVTCTISKCPLSFLPYNHPIKLQLFLSFLYQKIPKPPKALGSKMSLSYDLYVSLFLESLILDLSLLSNDLYDYGMAYVANEEWEVERRVERTIISGNTACSNQTPASPSRFVGTTSSSDAMTKGAPITGFGSGMAMS